MNISAAFNTLALHVNSSINNINQSHKTSRGPFINQFRIFLKQRLPNIRDCMNLKCPPRSENTNLYPFFYELRHKKVKVSFYIAQYPVLRTVQSAFTLYFPDRPVQSNTILTSLGSIQSHATINVRKAAFHHCL